MKYNMIKIGQVRDFNININNDVVSILFYLEVSNEILTLSILKKDIIYYDFLFDINYKNDGSSKVVIHSNNSMDINSEENIIKLNNQQSDIKIYLDKNRLIEISLKKNTDILIERSDYNV